MVRLWLSLFFLFSVQCYQQQVDIGDLAGDIFGQQQEEYLGQKQEESYISEDSAKCEEMKICVLCKMHLFWLPLSLSEDSDSHAAYGCHVKCSAYSVEETAKSALLQSDLPLCKINDDEDDDFLTPFGCNGPLWFAMQGNTVLLDFSKCEKHDYVQDGFGQLVYQSGDHLNRDTYIGYFKHGVREGYGTLLWNDGSRYSGQFHNDMKQGEGTMFYSNGDIFFGHWEEEKKEGGSGTYLFLEQTSSYTGSFSNGVQSGNGQYSTDETSFSGHYLEGQRKEGEIDLSNGDSYIGFFGGERNTYSGEGTYFWVDCGKKYHGPFVNGVPSGKGIMTSEKHDWEYEGEFKDGKFNGWGIFYWGPDTELKKHYFEGYFSQGQMTGLGKLYLENGSFFDGLGQIAVGTEFHADNKSFLEPIKGIYNNLGIEEEAIFDGKVLKYKVQKVIKTAGIKKTVKKTGYGK